MRTRIRDGLRFRVLKRDRFRCRYCGAHGSEVELHIDHVQPVSAGGTNHPSNLVTACRSCNLGKHAEVPDWEPCTDMWPEAPCPDPDCDPDFGYVGDGYVRNQYGYTGNKLRLAILADVGDDEHAYYRRSLPIHRRLFAFWRADGLGAEQCNPTGFGAWYVELFSELCGHGPCCTGDA